MSNNLTESSLIPYLNSITRELNRYIPLPALVLGTIGNLLNLLVFTRPFLQKNPCSLYFVSGSIANFVSLYVGLITPFLGLYNSDPTQRSNILCKTRYYLRFITITLSTWFVLFACVDRFLSSSLNPRYRAWSTPQLAKRLIVLATIVCFIFPYTQAFYCYSTDLRASCALVNSACKLTLDITLLVCNSGIPPLLMLLTSWFTLRNMKHQHSNHILRRRNVSVVQILFIQVVVLVMFAIPITTQKVYICATLFSAKSALTVAIDAFAGQIATEISYINNGMTFYAYSLTCKRFREEVSKIFSLLCTCKTTKSNVVRPRPATAVRFKSSLNTMICRIHHPRSHVEHESK